MEEGGRGMGDVKEEVWQETEISSALRGYNRMMLSSQNYILHWLYF